MHCSPRVDAPGAINEAITTVIDRWVNSYRRTSGAAFPLSATLPIVYFSQTDFCSDLPYRQGR
jgi:hypothetical protein